MPPPAISCITCDTPFPSNRELASMPAGDRIAFDPAHGRVWRICTRCETWNLLGPEAASAAMPELESRIAAGDGFAFEKVGNGLDLLRIGSDLESAHTVTFASRLRAQVDKQLKYRRWFLVVATVVFSAWAGGIFWLGHGSPDVPLFMLFLYAAGAFFERVTRTIKHKSLPLRASLAPGLVATATWIALYRVSPPDAGYLGFGVIAMLPVTWFSSSWEDSVRLMSLVIHGRRVRVARKDLEQVTLSWTGNGAVTFHDLPGGETVTGGETVEFGKRFFALAAGMAPDHQILVRYGALLERAYQLLRAAGGIEGLLAALDGFRRESDGRVVVVQLPAVYLIALRLALLEPPDPTDSALATQAAHAATLASVAERLEAGQ